MVYGNVLKTHDTKLCYHRKVLSVLTSQVVLTLAVNVICIANGFNELFSNWIICLAAAVATIGSVFMLVTKEDNRREHFKANLLLMTFVIGSSVFTFDVCQFLNNAFVILTLYAITTAVVSLFIGSLFAKSHEEWHWYMQVAGAVGCGVSTLVIPFFLSNWYGPDYTILWVYTVVFNALVAWYLNLEMNTHIEHSGVSLGEDEDYILASLYIYINWMWRLKDLFLKYIW